MQFNELFIFMKKLMIIIMVVLSVVAMATCLFCKKRVCTKETERNTPALNMNNIECGESYCIKVK